ncbi:MAG TPA: GNAT family protein [Flavisolibacter sp.]|nr:GNAT family protein [Flavisolibacter sp.]
MEFEIIETARLLLRKLTPETYDFVFRNYTEEELKTFFGCQKEDDMVEERKKFEQGLSMYRKSLLVFQLIDKTSGTVIGWCGYHTWYMLHYRAEVGYVLTDETKRRQGLMKEALFAVIRYGFEQMGLKRIEALTAPENAVSIRLLSDAGFVFEGKLREHYLVGESMEDSLIFSLLQREYDSKKSPDTEVVITA